MGIPHKWAVQVAAGQRDLSQVLEELARRDRVQQLIDRHELQRSLATQIVLGQADLEAVLCKRRRKAYVLETNNRSVFDQAIASEEPWSLATLGRSNRQVLIRESRQYELLLQPVKGGDPGELHKLQVKFLYRSKDRKALRKSLSFDKAYKGVVAEPIWRIQDRYPCHDKVLFPWYEAGTRLRITTVEGEQLSGPIRWFNRYEVGLELKNGSEVVVLRHAFADVSEA